VFLSLALQYRQRFRLNFLNCIKTSALQLDFHLEEEKEVGWSQ
jgi:hypothetical protein